MPASALLSHWDRARGAASDAARDRHSKRTSSPLTASSPAAKTPSASFWRGVRDHSFRMLKASNGSAIVYKDGRSASELACAHGRREYVDRPEQLILVVLRSAPDP